MPLAKIITLLDRHRHGIHFWRCSLSEEHKPLIYLGYIQYMWPVGQVSVRNNYSVFQNTSCQKPQTKERLVSTGDQQQRNSTVEEHANPNFFSAGQIVYKLRPSFRHFNMLHPLLPLRLPSAISSLSSTV